MASHDKPETATGNASGSSVLARAGKRPNILLLMVDQLAVPYLPFHGHPVVKAPNLARLAAHGRVFDSAYCNFPICAPSRASMLCGRLPHAIESWDNASEFPSDIPTVAHYLRRLGYHTALAGKMHFIGPDQQHGFEHRLTTDIYPSDYAWTPDWLKGPEYRPTGVSMRPVAEAGPCTRSMQIDYDDEVEYQGMQKIHDLARSPAEQPFFLTVSFTHPHPPFVASQRHWDLYPHSDIDMPRVAPIPYEKLDEHSRWLYLAHAQNLYTVTDDHIRNARHAYYGMISYIDEKIGRILDTLAETGLDRDTLIVFAGDHGEMLGERGMWFKQTFFESSVRVPLVFSWPGRIAAGRCAHHVSLVDLLPTLLDFAGGEANTDLVAPIDGQSLRPLLDAPPSAKSGTDAMFADREIIAEYSSEGVRAASRMVRRGPWKYVYTYQVAPMLFNLEDDPDELRNLAGLPEFRNVEQLLHERVIQDWDPDIIHQRILASQKRRLFLHEVAQLGKDYPNWAFQPRSDASRQFIRGSGASGPTSVKARARYPYVEPVQPDRTAS